MEWQVIREHYPQQWLLLEAIKAHSQSNKRVLEQLAVVGVFPDSVSAMHEYAQLHRKAPECELYVFHTSRAELDVTERQWLGNARWDMLLATDKSQMLLEQLADEALAEYRAGKTQPMSFTEDGRLVPG